MISDFLHSPDNFQEVIDFNKLQKLPSESPIYEFYIARLWHKKVFIKRLKQEYQDNPFYVSALKKEFEIGISLNHPSIPVYRDYKNGAIVIDYIDGETLSHLIKTGKLNEYSSELKKIISQLIDVTDYLHQNNITHCDIKTDNIIISKGTGNLILIDFDKCYTDAFDNTRANPENFGIGKNVSPSSEFDFYQISLLLKEILPFVAKSDKRYIIRLISTLQNDKVDPDKLRQILNQKFLHNKFYRNLSGLVILLIILYLIGVMIFKRTPQEEPFNSKGFESSQPIENGMPYSIKEMPINSERKKPSESISGQKALPESKVETSLDSIKKFSRHNIIDENVDSNKEESIKEYFNHNSVIQDYTVPNKNSNGKDSIETLINRRMNTLLKPYAEYLKNYEKAVDNPNISYEELTSLAQGSTDMLVKSMEEACDNLYKEFPEIDKGEIQKIAWISPSYLNLVNWNIEISERYGKIIMMQFNQ